MAEKISILIPNNSSISKGTATLAVLTAYLLFRVKTQCLIKTGSTFREITWHITVRCTMVFRFLYKISIYLKWASLIINNNSKYILVRCSFNQDLKAREHQCQVSLLQLFIMLSTNFRSMVMVPHNLNKLCKHFSKEFTVFPHINSLAGLLLGLSP